VQWSSSILTEILQWNLLEEGGLVNAVNHFAVVVTEIQSFINNYECSCYWSVSAVEPFMLELNAWGALKVLRIPMAVITLHVLGDDFIDFIKLLHFKWSLCASCS
jgi:hypothetical protein